MNDDSTKKQEATTQMRVDEEKQGGDQPQKKKRGRPSQKAQEPVGPESRQRSLDYDFSALPSDDDADGSDVDSDEDKVLEAFRGGPRFDSVTSPIEKPDFGDEHHMWFQTTQVGHVATLFKCFSKLLDREANVIFAPGGWRITAMNTTHIALISWRCTEQTLEEGIYECNYNYRVSVPVEEMAMRLKMCRRSEMMSLSLRGEKPTNMNMIFSRGPGRRTEMPLTLREPDDTHIEKPMLTYHTQIDLPADELREVLGGVKSESKITDITFTKHRRKFTVRVDTMHGPIFTHFFPDNSSDSARFLMSKSDAGNFEEESEDAEVVASANNGLGVLRGTFPIDEIITFVEVSRASKWLRINMPEEGVPLRMSCSLAALGEIAFLLAPKECDDDDDDVAGEDGVGGGGDDDDESNGGW